jgi:hypothetical protein
MKLQEVFDQLTYGELSQLSIGGNEAGVISVSNRERVIPHVNMALAAIYKRFPLKEGRVTVPLVAGTYTYTVVGEDINRIERIFTNSALKEELSLNNEIDIYSCFTTSPKVLVVPVAIVDDISTLPAALKATALDLVYRANHPKLQEKDADLDPDELELEIPYTYIEPLLYFVASRMLANTGTGQFEGLASNNYMQKYEMAAQLLTNLNPQVENTTKNARFRDGGWK